MVRICVIDDNDLMRDSVCQTLASADYQPDGFADPEAALAALLAERFDLVITDLKMPRMDGVTLLSRLRAGGCLAPVIVMTAFGTVTTAVEAMKLGAFDYLEKPFKGDVLEIVVERALAHGHLVRANHAFRQELADRARQRPIVAASAGMKRVLDQVRRIGPSNATVLITGESGTGKELIARAIQAESRRAGSPMLAVNCAALSPTLLESELFGHEKGAFTGADRMRQGRFELADGGTLLLDEIGELDDRLQAKLLRVLQEKEFERVGSSVSRPVDVRIIATTNRPLETWVGQGKFRQDLYYRLSVLVVHLPPLRERLEDVLPLARHLLEAIGRREGRGSLALTEEAEQLLQAYQWPGNVRELENLMERCSALSEDGRIGAEQVAGWLRGASGEASQPGAAPAARGLDLSSLPDGRMMDEMERRLILSTLKRFDGHRARTATALGIGLRTLGLKLRKYRQTGLMDRSLERDERFLAVAGG